MTADTASLATLDVASSYAAARALARREARHFYFAFRFLTPKRRDAMCAIYCFLRKLDDNADNPDERARARADRFAPSRAILQFAYGGASSNPDPIAAAFRDAVHEFKIPRDNFEEAIRGAEMDLQSEDYKTFAELRVYCYRAASVVGRMCIQIFGHESEAGRGGDESRAIQLADELGVAFQLTNILRDLREDAERGRVYLPQEDLQRFGVERADLLAPKAGEKLRKLLAYEAERARELYERSAPLSQLIDRRSRRALAGMRAMYGAILQKIERVDYDVLSRPVRLTTFEKARVAARVIFLGA
ncbi:MAG: phytoene/squalene synthase family protein [Planctomycetes bacterium]|nr:phytoene/squalene synthase family protein [Planctomycetota bacterium]